MTTTPRRSLPKARIVFNDGTMVSCHVQSLSESGAILQVHTVFGIPSAFRLTLSDQTQHPCWVVRKTTKEISVAFTDWQPALAEAIGA